jgi:hypothetical protein
MRRRSRYDTDPGDGGEVLETSIVHDVQTDPQAEAHALLDAVRGEVTVRLQREAERLEQMLASRIASVQAQVAAARTEAERVKADTAALKADPLFGLLDQLRRRLDSP